MPEAVVFVLRAVVLVLLWGFVIAAVVAVRHDVFGLSPAKAAAVRGAQASAPRRQQQPPSAAASSVATRLVVVQGALAGSSVPLTGLPITLGRAPSSTVVLDDDYVSNRHARLVQGSNGWVLEDLGSTNGTRVGNTRVQGSAPVPLGVQIAIGRTVLELRP